LSHQPRRRSIRSRPRPEQVADRVPTCRAGGISYRLCSLQEPVERLGYTLRTTRGMALTQYSQIMPYKKESR
jgi:hypothetical protein